MLLKNNPVCFQYLFVLWSSFYEVFNKKMRGVYLYFTQLENRNNKICLSKKYELNTHTY